MGLLKMNTSIPADSNDYNSVWFPARITGWHSWRICPLKTYCGFWAFLRSRILSFSPMELLWLLLRPWGRCFVFDSCSWTTPRSPEFLLAKWKESLSVRQWSQNTSFGRKTFSAVCQTASCFTAAFRDSLTRSSLSAVQPRFWHLLRRWSMAHEKRTKTRCA